MIEKPCGECKHGSEGEAVKRQLCATCEKVSIDDGLNPFKPAEKKVLYSHFEPKNAEAETSAKGYKDCTNCKYRFDPKGPCGDCVNENGEKNWEPRPEPAAMSYQERIAEARRLCETEETLAMLAEEAAELAQAALKLRRALGHGIPTGEALNGCWGALREEMADVQICVDMLSGSETARTVKVFGDIKSIKMLERLRKRDCGE